MNKVLVFVAVLVGVALAGQFLNQYLSQTQQKQLKQASLFDLTSPDKPLNELAYDEVRSQIKGERIQESRITGILKKAQKTPEGGIQLEIESTLPNSTGKTVWYRYDADTLPKISFIKVAGEGEENPTTFEDLEKGSDTLIDETNNYAKPYPQSIVSVKVTQISSEQ